MGDLTSSRWIKMKGGLFLVLALLCGTLLFLTNPTLKVALLLILTVWAFCRFYYFAFYVIERYVDPSYRVTGLFSFASYLFQRRPQPATGGDSPRENPTRRC